MRALVQRVASAQVQVEGSNVGQIGRGLLVYVGVAAGDRGADAEALAGKLAHLRIFDDERGRLNRSVLDVGGTVLVVPNFTLCADTRQGRRPSFDSSARGEQARAIYDLFVAAMSKAGCVVEQGRFGAAMSIFSVADGPVNVILDSPARSP